MRSMASLENVTAAFVEAVKRHMGDFHRATTGGDIDPEALSSAEKVQWAGWKRRDEVNGTARSLRTQGHSIEGIVRATGVSRQSVQSILAGPREDVFCSRSPDQGDKHCTEWGGGCRNGAELWRRLRDAGYGGSQRIVTEWATRRRRATKSSVDRPTPVTPVPPARTIARLLTSERDCRSAEVASLARQGRHRDDVARDRRGPQPPRPLQNHGGGEEDGRPHIPAARCARQRVESLRFGDQGRRGCRASRHRRALVQRSERGTGHQAQARSPPDIRSRQDRPSTRSHDSAGVKATAGQHQIRARAKIPPTTTRRPG